MNALRSRTIVLQVSYRSRSTCRNNKRALKWMLLCLYANMDRAENVADSKHTRLTFLEYFKIYFINNARAFLPSSDMYVFYDSCSEFQSWQHSSSFLSGAEFFSMTQFYLTATRVKLQYCYYFQICERENIYQLSICRNGDRCSDYKRIQIIHPICIWKWKEITITCNVSNAYFPLPYEWLSRIVYWVGLTLFMLIS